MRGRHAVPRDHREPLRRLVAGWHYPAGTGLFTLALVLLLLGVYPPMIRLPLSAMLLLVSLAIAIAPPAAPVRQSESERAWVTGMKLVRIAGAIVAVLVVWSLAGEPR